MFQSLSLKNYVIRLLVSFLFFCFLSCAQQPEKKECKYKPPKKILNSPYVSPEFLIQTGHLSKINALAISDNNKFMVTASMDLTMKLWNLQDSKELKTLKAHKNRVSAVDINSDGKYILSGGWDKKIGLWNAETGQLKFFKKAHRSNVYAVAISSDAKLGLSGSWNGNIKIWDLTTGKKLHSIYEHKECITSLAFNSDNTLALSGSRDNTIILWDVVSGKILNRYEGHKNQIFAVCFGPDDRQIFSGGLDKIINCWDLKTAKLIQTFKGHDGLITSLHVTPDNKYLFSGCTDKTIKKWNLKTAQVVKDYPIKNNSAFTIDFFKNTPSVMFAIGLQFPSYVQFDFSSEKIVKHIERDVHVGYKVAFSPDGSKCIVGGPFRPTCIWDMTGGKQLRAITDQKDGIYSLDMHSDGKSYISSGADSIIRWIDFETGQTIKSFTGHKSSIFSISFDKSGKSFASVGKDQTIRIWDTESGKETCLFKKKMPKGTVGILHPHEASIVIGGHSNKELVLLNTKTGKEITKFSGHKKGISAFTISPCGKFLLSGSLDRQIILWDIHSGKKLHSIKIAHPRSVSAIAMHPQNSKLILSGGLNGEIKLWDIEKQKTLKSFKDHVGIITALAFNPKKQAFISTCHDGKQILWDIDSGEKILTFVSFNQGHWIGLIPEGFYTASEKGGRYLNIIHANRTYTMDDFGNRFMQEDLVVSKLSGTITGSSLLKNQKQIINTLINIGAKSE